MPPRNAASSRLNHTDLLRNDANDEAEEEQGISAGNDQIEKSSGYATPLRTTDDTSYMHQNSLSMGYGGGPMGGMGYGAGAGGMYGSGMYGSGMMHGGGMGGPLTGLNQFLFSLQSVMFSMSQAIQIVGMNTQTFNQLFESATTMLDNALEAFHEMRTMDAISQEYESEEKKKRRKRLKALRWAVVSAITFVGYKVLKRILSRPHQMPPRILPQIQTPTAAQHTARVGDSGLSGRVRPHFF